MWSPGTKSTLFSGHAWGEKEKKKRTMGKGKEIITKFKTVKASLLATATLHRLLSVCASCQAQRWLRVYWNLQQVPPRPRGSTHLSWSNCSSAAQRSGTEEGARWWTRAWRGRREKLGGHRLALVNREVNTWSTCRIHLRGRTKRKEAHFVREGVTSSCASLRQKILVSPSRNRIRSEQNSSGVIVLKGTWKLWN